MSQTTPYDPQSRALIAWVPRGLRRLSVRLLHLYFRMSRGLTLGVRAAVRNEAGDVLLVRHTYAVGWHMPGGGVEPGETITEAVAKELREEANVVLTEPATLHGIFLNRTASQRDHVAVFIVHGFTMTAPKKADREIAEARFFPYDALPADTTEGTRRRLAEITEGRPATPDW